MNNHSYPHCFVTLPLPRQFSTSGVFLSPILPCSRAQPNSYLENGRVSDIREAEASKLPTSAAKDWVVRTCLRVCSVVFVLLRVIFLQSASSACPGFLGETVLSSHAPASSLLVRTTNMTSSEAIRGLRTLSRHATPRRIPVPRGGVTADTKRAICLDCRRNLRADNGVKRHAVSAQAPSHRIIAQQTRGYAQAAKECM
jgi:hypothetical protein